MSASCEVFVFQTTQRCHSVFCCRFPEGSFHVRLVASEKVATRFPPVVDRTSGSFPRFPIRLTLFRLRLTIPPGESQCLAGYSIDPRRMARKQNAAGPPLPLRLGRYEPLRGNGRDDAAHHEGVFDRPAVVPLPPSHLLEASGRVECARSDVGIAN